MKLLKKIFVAIVVVMINVMQTQSCLEKGEPVCKNIYEY